VGVEQDIFKSVKQALEDNATLQKYVNKVYDGLRSFDDAFVPQGIKNYIVLEPLSCEEVYPVGGETLDSVHEVPKQLRMTIGIVGVITAVANTDQSFVLTNIGAENMPGILELDEDIKNALDSSSTVQALSDAQVLNVSTMSFIFETFPKRKVSINLTIYRNIGKGDR